MNPACWSSLKSGPEMVLVAMVAGVTTKTSAPVVTSVH
ncbi:hypothetical protein [Enterobacter phage 04_vB_Eclo_IJM]|nr:hypothetical protein [Enterobacter phage 04_vB_Eclo_IJM]